MNDRVYDTRPERRKKPESPPIDPKPEPETIETIELVEIPDEPELVNENKLHAHKKAKAKHAN